MCIADKTKIIEDKHMNEVIEARTKRTKWYRDARFGMFIHWGVYAIPARGEWIRSVEEISHEEYASLTGEFATENYNPKEWARLAKKAGMKYAVLTAKHHDGFCLFDTKLTDFNSMNAACHRDIVREFLDAFRAEGIKVGLYYSLIDWRHPDYPHYGDMYHPMRNNIEYSKREYNFEQYLKFMFGQIEELLTNYGKLDLMWFDFSYGEMKGEKWKARELISMVRKIQPDLIIDNRLEGSGESSGSILTANPTEYSGDFTSPEQMIPPMGIRNEIGDSVPWEACITLNNHWGYAANDMHYKTAEMVVKMLVDCVSKDGNLLLNVGPDATGNIPNASVKILEEVGAWMKNNSRSIYGCGHADIPKPEWGRYTRKGNVIYAHIMDAQAGAILLTGITGKIKKMRLLSDNSEIRLAEHWNLKEYPEDKFIFIHDETCDSYPLPEEKDTVVEITLEM